MRKLIFLIILFLQSCFLIRGPEDYRWKGKEFAIRYPTGLRTDGVYIKFTDGEYNGLIDKGFSFIRFYPNGSCFLSIYFDCEIDDDIFQLNESNYGTRTYFRNKGNEIKIETYNNYNGWGFYMGNVDSAGISLWYGNSPLGSRYKFLPVEFKSGTADW